MKFIKKFNLLCSLFLVFSFIVCENENSVKAVDPFPDISIVVSVQNKAEWIRKYLKTLVEQSEKNMEFICVDNASVDDSKGLLFEVFTENEKNNLHVITKSTPIGKQASVQMGKNDAIGTYVAVLDLEESKFLYSCPITNEKNLPLSDLPVGLQMQMLDIEFILGIT